jgi:hypothetical protein
VKDSPSLQAKPPLRLAQAVPVVLAGRVLAQVPAQAQVLVRPGQAPRRVLVRPVPDWAA